MISKLNNIKSKITSGSERGVKAKKNIIGSILIKGCSILIQLILVPLTLDYLSPELYGIWLTVSSIMLWLNFFDVGFTLGLKNKLNEALALGDIKRGKALVSTTYRMMLVIFIPLGIILEFITPIVNWSSFLNVSQAYNQQLIDVIRILVTCFCLQMIFNTITSILAAYQRTALGNLFPVIGNFLSVIIIFILTKCVPPSLVNLALAISYLPVIVLIVSSIWLFSKQLREVAPNFRYFDKQLIKDLFSLGFKFFIIQIQMVVLYQSTNILISNISSPEQVTSYNIAYRYLGTCAMIFSIMLGPLWPAFTDAYTKKDFKWMQQTYKRMCKLYVLIATVVVVMTIVAPLVYKLWIGSSDLVPVFMTISVAIYVIIHTWDSLQVTLINGIGAVKIQTYVTIFGLIVHIPLSLYLGQYIGAYGVIVSMCLINVLYSTVFTIQVNKLINYKANRLWQA